MKPVRFSKRRREQQRKKQATTLNVFANPNIDETYTSPNDSTNKIENPQIVVRKYDFRKRKPGKGK